MVERLFLAVPRGCLRFVIVVFPDHTHYFCNVLFSVQDVSVASYLPRTLQICKENVLKVVTVFLFSYPERDGDVSECHPCYPSILPQYIN